MRISFASILLLCISCCASLVQAQNITYQIDFEAPQTHYAQVSIKVDDIPSDKKNIDFVMPVWAPGSYLIREYARHIEDVKAQVGQDEVIVIPNKINKNTWRVPTNGKSSLAFSYQVYAFEHTVRTSFIDESHASLIPTSIFMYVDGMKDEDAKLIINPYQNWKTISTSLKETAKNEFSIPSYDLLADSPIEIGNQEIFEFEAAGIDHQVVMYGTADYDEDKIKSDLTKIIEAATNVWGENPAEDYKFIVHNKSYGGGGLEHLNSTSLIVNRNAYRTKRGYLGFLGLAAHEYFHLWNVKRLRPFALTNYDYTQEQHTRLLWVFEGFTSYYDELLLRRAGITSENEYLKTLSNNIAGVENRQGRYVQPVTDASFDAWIKAYRPNENSSNTTVSYYGAGSVYAAVLDLIILHHTDTKQGLDDLMEYLYEEYYKKLKRGYTEAEFRRAAEKIAGTSLDTYFDDYVYGTKPVDYNKYLQYAGLKMEASENNKNASLGINTRDQSGKLVIRTVKRNGSGYLQGLNVNDEIIAIDNFRVSSSSEIRQILQHKEIGDKIEVLISRDDVLRTIEITLQASPDKRYSIVKSSDASKKQVKVRNTWLRQEIE